MEAKDRIILALDVDTESQALNFVETLKDHVGAFKIGMQLFNSTGPEIVSKVNNLGGKIFVDLKFHDIPNTVAATSRVMARLGCYMFNVHAAGGREMMKQAALAVKKETESNSLVAPKIIAVTVLTSLSQEELNSEVRVLLPVEKLVVEWAEMAKESGMDGVVASPKEVTAIRRACGPDFMIVTPGVRPDWADAQDQKRVTTPHEAIAMGSDYLVIGRPITGAKDPVLAAQRIISELV
ncbi:MAG: orotidine-5'-phosphate decarboxylase [Ignavibacteriales bacterium]